MYGVAGEKRAQEITVVEKQETGYLTAEASGYARHLLNRWALIQQKIAADTVAEQAAIAEAQAKIQEVKNQHKDEVEALQDELKTLGHLNQKTIGSVAAELKYTSGYNRISWNNNQLERLMEILGLLFPNLEKWLLGARKVTPVKPRATVAMRKDAESLLPSNVEKEAEQWEGWGSDV